ncbi:MAG: PH domain-containing protein [Halobacteriaceae archaeon]
MNALDPRVRVVWAGRAVALAAVLGAALVLADRYALAVPAWAVVAVVALAATLGLAHTALRYRRWRYEVQEDALYLERGVVTEVETAVPFVRIQHVDTQRGPLERLAGVTSVVVYTAGSRGADVTVPGLDPERARTLQRRLRQLAVVSEAGDAV